MIFYKTSRMLEARFDRKGMVTFLKPCIGFSIQNGETSYQTNLLKTPSVGVKVYQKNYSQVSVGVLAERKSNAMKQW